jgi:hypothetical protein
MNCYGDKTCKHGCHDDVRCKECDAEALDRAVEMEIERKRELRDAAKDFHREGPIPGPMEHIHPYDVTVFYHCNHPEDS